MAMLQAARARRLGLPEESAFSWGLNRAIFYAAAKRGFRARAAPGGEAGGAAPGKERKPDEKPRGLYSVGDEEAYRDETRDKLYFTIGGETQTEREFERQIASRFGGPDRFREAWGEAERIVAEFDEDTLRSQRGFYETVYKPRRDQLVEEWTERYLNEPPARS
jgi:hypothetical protein